MATPSQIEIHAPANASDYEAVRALFVGYADSLDFSLAYQDFETELAELPGKYAPPDGALLLARVDGVPAGTVALRRWSREICEMKRLYVVPSNRGQRTSEGLSIGRALVAGIITEARMRGYRSLRLDTIGTKMKAATHLYESFGFVEIAPYYLTSVPDTVFMELVLAGLPKTSPDD